MTVVTISVWKHDSESVDIYNFGIWIYCLGASASHFQPILASILCSRSSQILFVTLQALVNQIIDIITKLMLDFHGPTSKAWTGKIYLSKGCNTQKRFVTRNLFKFFYHTGHSARVSRSFARHNNPPGARLGAGLPPSAFESWAFLNKS